MALSDACRGTHGGGKIHPLDSDDVFDAYLAGLGLLLDLPLDGLRTVVETRATLDRLESLLVREARRSASSWAEIGAALGVSRQAAHARHVGSSSAPAGSDPDGPLDGEPRA